MSAHFTRRGALALGAGAAAGAFAGRAFGQAPVEGVSAAPAPGGDAAAEKHGLSAFGELKYPADFKHFDYVRADAPKAGTFSQTPSQIAFNQNFITFNSLNSFVLRGDAAVGMELTFATLMARALDEPDAVYGNAAASVSASADGLAYRFRLRPEATFHDGSKLTPADVAFSLMVLKEKGHPLAAQLLRDLDAAEPADEDVVLVRFKPTRTRDLPLTVSSMPIFSKAYYATRDFEATTLEAPLGSGPYKVGRFEQGRYIEYDLVEDWWGRDLPVNRGQWNFARMRYEFFRDRDVAFEGFKGRAFLFREDATARVWARGYDFPAAKDGRVVRETLPDDTPSGAQGWFLNLRRQKFQDKRVREALILAFDFEWMNKNLMFDAYKRTASYFQNSDLMANGPPSPEELALLEPLRGKVPDEVFGEPWTPPVSDGSGQDRKLLREAARLLREAGYANRDGRLVNGSGEPLTMEFLEFDPGLDPHVGAYIKNLKILGITGNIRLVDPAQFQSRLNSFDFDVISRRFSMSPTPGEGLRQLFSSTSANLPGSSNYSGIADPSIDALVEKVVNAQSRAELTVATRALDRVIRAGRFWVPAWYKGSHTIAYWDVYARPPEKPRYARGFDRTWWWDKAKADRLGIPG